MATPAHCYYCFDVLAAHLSRRPALPLSKIESHLSSSSPASPDSSGSNSSAAAAAPAKTPLFVTWKKRHGGGHELRGCIGTFAPQPLEDGLRDYALTAALHDTRFRPVAARELPELQCAVTLLTDFEDAEDVFDWELGTHGIQIHFEYRGRKLGATYLPDVPVEQGWSKEEALVSLMRKAGWTGRKEEWRDVPVRLTRYRGDKCTVGWEEYERFRESLE